VAAIGAAPRSAQINRESATRTLAGTRYAEIADDSARARSAAKSTGPRRPRGRQQDLPDERSECRLICRHRGRVPTAGLLTCYTIVQPVRELHRCGSIRRERRWPPGANSEGTPARVRPAGTARSVRASAEKAPVSCAEAVPANPASPGVPPVASESWHPDCNGEA